MSIEELYDQVAEEKLMDEIGKDNDEIDEEVEFLKKTESKWELQPIDPKDIKREKIWEYIENYAGHPCPVLKYAGSLPMISLRDEHFKPQKNIVMTSCMEFLSEDFQKIFDWIYKHPDDVLETEPEAEEDKTPEYEVPRAIQGLAKLVDDARENISEIVSPTMFTKKKKMRLLRDKKNLFLRAGADQIGTAIVQHIEALVHQGHFPIHMFGDYSKHCAAIKKAIGEQKIVPLLDLILCAEVVMPSQELLIPRKRISAGLPSAGSGA